MNTTQWKNELEISNAEVLLQAFENTDICVFTYYPQERRITVSKKACDKYQCRSEYTDMPGSFADDFVYPGDYKNFVEMYRLINEGAKTATTRFHNKDRSACCRVTLSALEWSEDRPTGRVIGIIEDISEWETDKQMFMQAQNRLAVSEGDDSILKEAGKLILATIGEQYYALYHIWLDNRTYICYQGKRAGELITNMETPRDYEEGLKHYIEDYVVPEDRDGMKSFTDINTLAGRLAHHSILTFEFRRKELGWTRGQFIAAKWDDKGNVSNVVYTVTDINAEKSMEVAKEEAIYEAQHDPLTGVYNRNGFEEIISSPDLRNTLMGFAIIDIDNFKIVNDAYGHEVGDKVLAKVAELLTDVFRADDTIFRMGGDEFAVILRGCPSIAWNTLCEKQSKIHTSLSRMFDNMTISLSIGICFTSDGYNEEVYHLADRMLYEIKRNGRAGCAMIDAQSGQEQYWRDNELIIKAQNILEYNNTGLYRIEYDLDETKEPRLICGEMTKELFAFPKDAEPEECYKLWLAGIDSSYLDIMAETRETLLRGVQAECTYKWNHPRFGKIFVRTGGKGEIIDGIQILHGYHHSMQDTKIMERRDENLMIFDAMNNIYFCSYYIDLDQNSFSVIKHATDKKPLEGQFPDAAETIQMYLDRIVDKGDLDKMKRFMDLGTIRDRLKGENHLDCEYLSVTDKNWCRATFFPVKYDKNGTVTHVLFVSTSLDENKAGEVQEGRISRKSLEELYNNVPGGIVMYEWDGRDLKTLYISEYYKKKYGVTLTCNKGGPDFSRVHPDDVEAYRAAVRKALEETHEIHYEYRVWNQNKEIYTWERIDAKSKEQADGIDLVFAIYTNITEQKHLELELEKEQKTLNTALGVSNLLSYEYDPVTHIGTCFTPENYFGLPAVIENYPEVFRETELFHPDDVELFIETTHKMDAGTATAQCDVRIRRQGEYRWYSCAFNAYYDLQKERNVAILTVVDISDHKSVMADYENRIESVMRAVENSLAFGQCNLTNNTVAFFHAVDEMFSYVEKAGSFDERFENVADFVVGEGKRKEFRRLFNRENLLKMAAEGGTGGSMEYFLRMPGEKTLWLETGVDLIKNPLNNDITAISYSKSVGESNLPRLILKNTLEQEYMQMAVVFTETEEYYLLDGRGIVNGEYRDNFWKRAVKEIARLGGEYAGEHLENLDREKIEKALAENNEYIYSGRSEYLGDERLLQVRFSYLVEDRSLLLVSLQNTTDESILEKLRYDNEHDSLTDLYNRKKVFDRCRQLLNEHPDDKFAMVHVDMRHFRLFNTFFGDSVGDKLLCDVAQMFRGMDPDYEYWAYGRIEADVFCAFFPYDEELYHRHVSDILRILQDYRKDFLIEPVLGMYFVEDPEMPIEAMFTRATLAAKSVRRETPYATVIYDESLEKKLVDEQWVINEMKEAISAERFELYLQPKYSLRTLKPTGAEALVRWIDPQKGMIMPGRFIPVFENNDFITTFDRYVWEHACMMLSRWQKEGRTLAPVSVNVSRASMFSQTTVSFLKELIEKYSIDPYYLELELTEGSFVDDPEEMKEQMQKLKAAGFRIALDDFGSGYSSLNVLRDLPVDSLKLDMRFLSSDAQDYRGKLVVSSVVRMGKLLGLPVIAEGVEIQEQAEFLQGIGCEYVQGYLFAKPMPVAEYEKLMENSTEPLYDAVRANTEHIGKIIADSSSGTYALGEVIPSPLALIEYASEQFSFLRVNPEFYKEFNLTENTESVSEIFKKRLTEESYERMIQTFEKSIFAEEKLQVCITWQCEDGTERVYVCNVAYEGNFNAMASIVLVFTNVTEAVKSAGPVKN